MVMGAVLVLVRQAAGLKLRSLPGGCETRRVTREGAETRSTRINRTARENWFFARDRRDKDSITLLFAAFPDKVKTIEIFDPLEPAPHPISTP